MGWLDDAAVELGLDDELAAGDGERVVGVAVDAAVSLVIVQLSVEATW